MEVSPVSFIIYFASFYIYLGPIFTLKCDYVETFKIESSGGRSCLSSAKNYTIEGSSSSSNIVWFFDLLTADLVALLFWETLGYGALSICAGLMIFVSLICLTRSWMDYNTLKSVSPKTRKNYFLNASCYS